MKFPCKQWCVLCLVTQSCPTHRNQMDCSLTGSSVHEDSTDKNTGMGCQALLQGIFPTQGSTRSPTLQVNSLPAEPPGKSKNTRVAAYPFSRGSSWPRNQTGVSCIAGGFFISWATREAHAPVGRPQKEVNTGFPQELTEWELHPRKRTLPPPGGERAPALDTSGAQGGRH